MRREGMRSNLTTVTWFALGLLLLASATRSVTAQSCRPTSSVAPDEALRLVVKLKTYAEKGFYQDGTGIIIGERGDTLLVATAAHVVLDAEMPVDSIRAYFYADCLKPVVAQFCASIKPRIDLDLAVLCIPAARAPGAKPPSLSFLGSVRRLGARTPVYPVGCPSGECWGVGPPDKVLVVNQSRILFTTFFVVPGHSGGALFNEWWEVVGMLTKLGQPLSEAIPIESVLNVACDSTCRKQERTLQALKSPFVPRGGYRLSVGVNALFAGAHGDPGGRFPPGRVNLMYRVNRLVDLRAGSLRLTPENLSITGAMMGLGLNLPPTGRVWLNPFVEGGFGHVEGRFDAGGYFIDNQGTNVPVPLWRQVKADGLGYGAGGSLMVLAAPRTILELTVGHWSFNRPTGAPGIPNLVWGAGLRFGM